MKRYISYGRERIIFVKVLGKNRMICFKEIAGQNRICVYSSDSEAICSAIEENPEFNKTFFLEDTTAKAEIKDGPRVYDKVYDTIKRTQDAKSILETEYGIDRSTIPGRAEVLAEADKLNIDFPVLRGYEKK